MDCKLFWRQKLDCIFATFHILMLQHSWKGNNSHALELWAKPVEADLNLCTPEAGEAGL